MPSPNTGGRVPAIPATSYIKDPHIRAAIDAMKTGWDIRNGTTGRGDYAFITKAEVLALIADTTTTANTKVDNSGTAVAGSSSPSLTTYLQLTDEKPNTISGEINGWAVDITQKTVNGSMVPMHTHGVSDGTHVGNLWGIATEVYNASTKTAGFNNQLFGAEFSIINMITNSTAFRHAGNLLVFKNRLDTQNTPVKGPGVYNANSSAIYIDSGGGRDIGSATDVVKGTGYGDPNIECGWQRGVYFSPFSMDTAGGKGAVGIEMTDLGIPDRFGVPYSKRLLSAIAIPDNSYMSFSTNKTDARLGFETSTGKLKIVQRTGANPQQNGSGIDNERFSVQVAKGWMYSPTWYTDPNYLFGYRWNAGNGTLEYTTGGALSGNVTHAFGAVNGQYYQQGYSNWLDLGNSGSDAILSFVSGARTRGPTNPVIINWVGVRMDGQRYTIALYPGS